MNQKKPLKKLITYTLALLTSLILSILVIIIAVVTVVFYGPSPTARDMLVLTSLETSAMKFVPHLYFSQAQIDAIIAANSAQEPDGSSDGDDITIPTDEIDLKKIEVFNISGPTFVGKMMIVNNPARVHIGMIETFSDEKGGQRLLDMVKTNNAIGGINGGLLEMSEELAAVECPLESSSKTGKLSSIQPAAIVS